LVSVTVTEAIEGESGDCDGRGTVLCCGEGAQALLERPVRDFLRGFPIEGTFVQALVGLSDDADSGDLEPGASRVEHSSMRRITRVVDEVAAIRPVAPQVSWAVRIGAWNATWRVSRTISKAQRCQALIGAETLRTSDIPVGERDLAFASFAVVQEWAGTELDEGGLLAALWGPSRAGVTSEQFLGLLRNG
jgi:hypothetical protein